MRKKASGDVDVLAVSGTHVVFLGFDMEKAKTKNLMGFAIHRKDKTEDEGYWLRSTKTFPGTDLTATDDVTSHEHPFQAFQWADYTAKPEHEYEYRVVPMYGSPGNLTEGTETKVKISTESADPEGGSGRGVYFNRGAIASQAYVKRFGLKQPKDIGPSAENWLTRDLLPAMLAFIARAKAGWSLHCALYEVGYRPVLDALEAARGCGATVHVLYGATPDSTTTTSNEEELADLPDRTIYAPRTNAKIAHNKFIVLSRGAKPVAVWTGSTNLSYNAMFGQLNVGIRIDDAAVAKTYRAYWDALAQDPETGALRDALKTIAPLDINSTDAVQVIFSPYTGKQVYDFYVTLAMSAKHAVFMTFPFGMSKEFREAYDHNDAVIRYSLLDKYVNGGSKDSRQAAIDDTIRIRKLPNVGMALGAKVFTNDIDGWRTERSPIGVNVDWVHTKFMVIDPLSTAPTVVSGSANWSIPSTNENDENMVVIRGDTRIADIYFTEFMRVFAHHRFREALKRFLDEGGDPKDWRSNHLETTAAKWLSKHFEAGSEYEMRRTYFCGA